MIKHQTLEEAMHAWQEASERERIAVRDAEIAKADLKALVLERGWIECLDLNMRKLVRKMSGRA